MANRKSADELVRDFETELASFRGFNPRRVTVGDLTSNTKWDWAGVPGVYCFVRDGRPVYVGRALGKTIGERLWNHLRSTSDPAWAEVVGDPETVVDVFEVDASQAFLAAALEAYLIEALEPQFNLGVS